MKAWLLGLLLVGCSGAVENSEVTQPVEPVAAVEDAAVVADSAAPAPVVLPAPTSQTVPDAGLLVLADAALPVHDAAPDVELVQDAAVTVDAAPDAGSPDRFGEVQCVTSQAIYTGCHKGSDGEGLIYWPGGVCRVGISVSVLSDTQGCNQGDPCQVIIGTSPLLLGTCL